MEKKFTVVGYADLLQSLEQIFGEIPDLHLGFEIAPGNIANIAKQYNVKFKFVPFEFKKEPTDEEVFSILFGGYIFSSGDVQIVTEECISSKKFYNVPYKFFKEFVLQVYPDIHKMDFFQHEDVIFINIEEKLIVVVHHEGYYAHIKIQH